MADDLGRSNLASFETAALRPPQLGDPLMRQANLPHPEERPEGARLEGRVAPVQPLGTEMQGAAADWQQTLWAMVGIQFVMTMAFSMLTPIMPLFLPVLGVESAS